MSYIQHTAVFSPHHYGYSLSAQSVALKLSNIVIAWRLWEMQAMSDPFFASLNQDLYFNKILWCFEHSLKFELEEAQLLNLNFLFQMFIVRFWLFLNCPFPSFACFKIRAVFWVVLKIQKTWWILEGAWTNYEKEIYWCWSLNQSRSKWHEREIGENGLNKGKHLNWSLLRTLSIYISFLSIYQISIHSLSTFSDCPCNHRKSVCSSWGHYNLFGVVTCMQN